MNWNKYHKENKYMAIQPQEIELIKKLPLNGRVVDFGCGNAAISEYIKNYEGYDFSKEAIKKNDKVIRLDLNKKFIKGGNIRMIIMRFAIPFLKKEVIEKCFDILEKDGYLYVLSPVHYKKKIKDCSIKESVLFKLLKRFKLVEQYCLHKEKIGQLNLYLFKKFV